MLRDIFLMSRPPLLRKEGNAAAAKVVGNSFTGSMTTGVMLIAGTAAVVSGNGRARTTDGIYQDRDKPLVLCKA